jgi:SnoaL-like domain
MRSPSFEDFYQITQKVYTFAYALDHRDWDLMRSVFADRMSVDTSRVRGDEADNAEITAEEMVWNVKLTETGFEGTQLLFGNPMVTVDGDTAQCTVCFYGEHVAPTVSGDPTYTIGGYQYWGLTKVDGGWLLSSFRLEPLWTRGNRDVMNIGVQRGAERLTAVGDPPPAGLVERHRY